MTGDKLQRMMRDLSSLTIFLPGSQEYEELIFTGNLVYANKRPLAVVLATSTADVQTVVQFARQENITLNVKNGRHSYAGYCLNSEGIVLDVSPMNNFHLDHINMTVTVEAGTIWKNVYEHFKAQDRHLVVIGGMCPTVGVSGFTLGGGLSPFTRSYGLGSDNILEMTVVTAEGEVLDLTNSETDRGRQDLWWALCGSGGGNFAIATNFTLRVHELRYPTVVCGDLSWKIPEEEENFIGAMSAFNEMDAPNELCLDPFWHYDQGGEQLLAQMTIIYNGTMEECNNTILPLLSFQPSGNDLRSMPFWVWEKLDEQFFNFEHVYQHHVSFIFGEGAITPEFTRTLLNVMKQAPALSPPKTAGDAYLNECRIVWDNIGGVAANIPSTETSFFWRNGRYVMDVMVQWATEEQSAKARAWTKLCSQRLAPFSIEGKAAYLNYIDDRLQNWQYCYYGQNYSRLQRVKSECDPSNFFHFGQSVELPNGGQGASTSFPDDCEA